MGDVSPILTAVKDAGVIGVLILTLLGGYRRWWVWGWQLAEAEARCAALMAAAHRREEEWKELALRGGRVAEHAVSIAKRRGV